MVGAIAPALFADRYFVSICRGRVVGCGAGECRERDKGYVVKYSQNLKAYGINHRRIYYSSTEKLTRQSKQKRDRFGYYQESGLKQR